MRETLPFKQKIEQGRKQRHTDNLISGGYIGHERGCPKDPARGAAGKKVEKKAQHCRIFGLLEGEDDPCGNASEKESNDNVQPGNDHHAANAGQKIIGGIRDMANYEHGRYLDRISHYRGLGQQDFICLSDIFDNLGWSGVGEGEIEANDHQCGYAKDNER